MTREEIQKNSEHWYNKYKDAEKRITDLENKIADIKANCDLAIEGRDIKIMELEKENAELKSELTKKADTNHSLVEQMADLESENAELKAKNKWYSEQVCYKECAEVWGNLTKAKEILKKFIETSNPIYFEEDRQKVKTQAEQFLKEIEK